MEFIETQTFTRLITDLLTDEQYTGLQNILVADPERGDLIKGGGGIRKLRYALAGVGKSGGVRAIYYWLREDQQIYMLLIYPKTKKITSPRVKLGCYVNWSRGYDSRGYDSRGYDNGTRTFR